MNCIIPNDIFKDVGIAKVNPTRQTNNKSMQWDITKVSNQMVYNLFFGSDQAATLDEVRHLIGNPEIFLKIKESILKSKKSNKLLEGMTASEDPAVQNQMGNEIKFRAVTFHEIVSSIENEANVERNIGIKDEDILNSLKATDGSRLINSIPVKQTIGRILLNQRGVRLIGEPDAVAAVHSKIGDIAISNLEKTGLIVRQKDKTILNPDYKKEDKTSMKKQNVLVLKKREVIRVNNEALMTDDEAKDQENKNIINKGLDSGKYEDTYEFDAAEETMSVAAGLSRLVIPVNTKPPLNEGEVVSEENEPQIKDLGNGDEDSAGVVEQHEKLLKTLSKKRQRINPVMNTFMMHLHNTLKDLEDINSIDPEVTLKKLYAAAGITNKNDQEAIFGTFVGSTDDNFKSEIGRSISRENPMLQLIMYYPELVSQAGNSKDFYHHIGIYRTTRMEYLSTFLNEQMDKYFARALVQGHPVTFNANTALGQSLSNQMLHSIIDESGLDIRQIQEVGFDPALDTLIEQYEETFKGKTKDATRQTLFIKNLASGYLGRDMKKNFDSKVMTTIDILGALSDIRKAQKNGGKLTTAYRTKLDAAASGIMLSFMQNAGKDKDIAGKNSAMSLLTELGYTKDQIGKDPILKDAYHILLRGLRRLSEDQLADDKGTFKLMEDLANLGIFGDNAEKAMRNLAKPMTMITNYQAGENTAIAGTSAELRESVISHLVGSGTTEESVKFIKKKIRDVVEKDEAAISKYGKDFYEKKIANKTSTQIVNIEGINEIIESFFAENLSNTMREVIENEMSGATSRPKERIGKAYKLSSDIYMNESKNDKISQKNLPQLGVLPAMTWNYIVNSALGGNTEMLYAKNTYEAFMNADIVKMTDPQFDKYIKDFGKFHFEILQKYKMPLTSRRQVLAKKNGVDVVYLTEVPNSLTASVNTIHGLDAAIFFKSHEDTLAELDDIIAKGEYNGETLTKDEIKGFKTASYNASGMIHDANNADPYYNLVYASHYTKNSVELSKSYDIEEQLAMTYISNYQFGGNFSNKKAKELLIEARENRIKKQEALEDIADSYKFFGFKDSSPTTKLKSDGSGTTSSSESNKGYTPEKADKFLTTKEGKADLALSEKENGKYDRHEHTFEKEPYDAPPRFEGDEDSSGNISEEDQVKNLKNETTAYKNLINSGDIYWKYDLETSFSTENNPLNEPTILEFYAEEYTGGQPTGRVIKEKFLPEFPEQYDAAILDEDKGLMPYSYFRDGVSHFIEEKNGALTFTREGYDAWLENIATQLPNGIGNMVAYNGAKFDHPFLSKELNSIGIEWNPEDYGYDSMLVSNDANWDNKDIPDRKLKTVFDGVSTDQEKAKAKKLGKAHSAEVDIFMMNVVETDALNSTEKRDDGSKLYNDDGVIDESVERSTHGEVLAKFDQLIEARPELEQYIEDRGMGNFDTDNKSSYNTEDDIVYLTDNAGLTIDEIATQIVHEIAHQKSVGFIGAFSNDPDVLYVKNNMSKIKDRRLEIFAGIKDKAIKKRLDSKVFNEKNPTRALLEFVAILEAEPEVREALKNGIDNKTLLGKIYRLLKKFSDFILRNDTEVDFDNVMKSIRSIMEQGHDLNMRDQDTATIGRNKIAEDLDSTVLDKSSLAYDAVDARNDLLSTSKYRKKVRKKTAVDTVIEKGWREINQAAGIYTNQLLLNMLVPNSEYYGGMAHKKLMRKSDVYKKTVLALTDIWTVSEPMASMKGYVDRARVGDLYALNIMEKLQMEAEQEMATFETETIAKIKRLIKNSRYEDKKGKEHKLSDLDIKNMGKATAYAPIFHLINEHGDLNRIKKSADPEVEIATMIEELKVKAVMGYSTLSDDTILKIEALGMVLAKKATVSKGSAYNIEQMDFTEDLAKETAERLVALYALLHTDNVGKTMTIMAQNQDMASEIERLSNGLKAIADQTLANSNDRKVFRENMVGDVFSEAKEFRAIDARSLRSNEFSHKNGWKVIREPSGNEYGIAYRDRTRITNQSGAGITENFKYYDIVVGKDIQNGKAENVVKVSNETNEPYHKLVLTQEELDSMGSTIDHPADMLARSYAQMLMVKQTQAARNFIVYGDKIKKLNTDQQAAKLNKKIRKMEAKDHPWFVSIPDGSTVADFLDKHPNIKALYKEPEQLSRINGFNEHIDLVRKDMHDMIVGYEDPAFANDSTPQKMFYVLRKTVVLVKQAWVILSPEKIASDIASNQIILAGYGVPIGSIMVNQARAIGLSAEMSELRSKYVMTTFEMHAEIDSNKKDRLKLKLKIIEKNIEKHPMAAMVQNGMMQSVSTDILLKDRSVVSGLQEDIEKILNFGLHKSGGVKPNNISKAIMVLANSGWSVDDAIKGIGQSLQSASKWSEFGGRVGDQFVNSAKRVKQKKKDKDTAKFLSEFLGAPDSEVLRMGSYLVQMADIAARYTLYTHLKNNNNKIDVRRKKRTRKMNEEEIVLTVMEAFVDYKVNMPKEVKYLSDHGILLFPSFWMRIQKIIYSISKNNPLKVGTGLILAEALDLHIASYYDSNIFSKFGEIFNAPPPITDPWDIVIPTALYEQASFGVISF